MDKSLLAFQISYASIISKSKNKNLAVNAKHRGRVQGLPVHGLPIFPRFLLVRFSRLGGFAGVYRDFTKWLIITSFHFVKYQEKANQHMLSA